MFYRSFLLSAASAALIACGGSSSDSDDASGPDEIVIDDPRESVTYELTLTSLWDEEDHLSRPSNAHFSPIVAVSHTDAYRLLPFGETASAGFEQVAEAGGTTIITQEAEAAQGEGEVDSIVRTQNQFVPGTPTQTFEVEVSRSQPYLSLVSMIAPSPDWVIGLDSIELYTADSGFSSESMSLDLYAIDAGTEGGDNPGNFALQNPDTSPRQAIEFLDQSLDGFDKPFARIEIKPLDL